MISSNDLLLWDHIKIHLFILAISIAPLQVLYYSRGAPDGYCIGVSCRSTHATAGKGLAQGPYVVAWLGVEPTTRLKVMFSTKAPPHPIPVAEGWKSILDYWWPKEVERKDLNGCLLPREGLIQARRRYVAKGWSIESVENHQRQTQVMQHFFLLMSFKRWCDMEFVEDMRSERNTTESKDA